VCDDFKRMSEAPGIQAGRYIRKYNGADLLRERVPTAALRGPERAVALCLEHR
jgi:hypothetical protein